MSTLKFIPIPTPIVLPRASQLITRVVDPHNQFPCRRCLQDGQVGEIMLLIPYNPFPSTTSPYAGSGPIFVHEKECARYEGTEVQEQQRKRLLSLRAYDGAHMMVDQAVVNGAELQERAEQMLTGAVGYVNVHYAGPGCFAVRVEMA